jgi:hypothetical protein
MNNHYEKQAGLHQPRPKRRAMGTLSLEFISLREARLIADFTNTREKAEIFMNHFYNNYGVELKRQAEARAALRASHGYPFTPGPVKEGE